MQRKIDPATLATYDDRTTTNADVIADENLRRACEDAFDKAARELSDAVTWVAGCAREVSDEAEANYHGGGVPDYTVDGETMDQLRDALKRWRAASEAAVQAMRAGGGR